VLRWSGAAPKVMYAPAIRIVPLADDTDLLEATRRCLAAPLDVVVATTGIGFRGWMEAAEAWDLGDDLLVSLEAATLLARGPKAPWCDPSVRPARRLVAGSRSRPAKCWST